jgi:GT2 family glycosyltransferase
LARTVPDGTRLVAVDAGSPPDIAARLRELAAVHEVLLLRVDGYLAPNEARILALPHVDTEYVVFIDNDAFGDAGWLERLEACADDTGAWAVGPLYGIGHPDEGRVHMAGGRNRLLERDGQLVLDEAHLHAEEELVATLGGLERSPTELIEFHCVLLRRSALDVTPLDPRLLSLLEHNSLCLEMVRAGGTIWLEPSARVTYHPARRLSPEDVTYFCTRWGRQWNRLTVRRFAERWGLDEDVLLRAGQIDWAVNHRNRVAPSFAPFRRLPHELRRPVLRVVAAAERHLPVHPREFADGAGPPIVVHAPAWAPATAGAA